VLFAVNSASKILQSKDMQIDVAINQLKTLLDFFKNYRETGFATAISLAIEIAKELEIEPVLLELAESSDQDSKIRSEANSLAKYEFGDFEF
jgi:hypothetical protein